MKLYLVRHGKPEGSEKGKRFLGLTDEPLSERGIEQAHQLGSVIAAQESGKSVRIVSSSLSRCFKTALIIKEHLHGEFIETDRDLREINMGDWDGRYFDEIRREFPEEFEARGRDLWNYIVPGGESFAEAGERFRETLDNLVSRAAADDVIVIVSHAGVIRAGLSLMTEIPFEEWMKNRITYAGAVLLDVTDGNISVTKQILTP